MPDLFEDALETPARKVWQILKDNLGGSFKAYYYGDPVVIPESLMPCIVVDTLTNVSDLGPTQYDELTTGVMVKVIFNKKDDFNSSDVDAVTKQKVEYYTEGRDISTGNYLPNTVQGILRKNISLENEAQQFTSNVNYDVIIRPEETITQEAHITMSIASVIQVPGRT